MIIGNFFDKLTYDNKNCSYELYLKFLSTNDEMTSAVNQKEYLRAKYLLQLNSLRVTPRRKRLSFKGIINRIYVHSSILSTILSN